MISMEEEHSRSNNLKIIMKINMLFFCSFFLLLDMCCCVQASSRSIPMETQTLDVQKYLNTLNKAPLMSIQSPDGDTIDCVHISKQPAFDHPLLKNHLIQMTPNYHPQREGDMFVDNKLSKNTNFENRGGGSGSGSGTTTNNGNISQLITHQLWHKNGRCPQGTIPIRRTTKDDLLRANSVERFGKKRLKTIPLPTSVNPDINSQNGHQHAIGYVEGGKYYGAKATINVWQPQIQQPNEFSLSQIWILGGSFDSDLNSVEAGWQVSPDLYGDNNTRLFTYWTSDAYQATGCYNLLCSGFIQISNDIAMGASIRPLSTYSGSQYDVSVLVWKDPKEGNWWMQYGNDHVVGYWPASLFSYLVDSASMIEWGGEVVNAESDGLHTTTQMGSGHFPGEGFGKSSYFKNIQIVDGSNRLRDPDGLDTFTEQPDCYNVNIQDGGGWGKHFYYGGPGRNVNCP